MKNTRYLDICTVDGTVIFTLCLTEREEHEPSPAVRQQPPVNGEEKETPFDPMTEPQRRKLFRMLAEQGIEGDKAHAELMKRFQVSDLNEVSKQEASRMIERLIEETKGGS